MPIPFASRITALVTAQRLQRAHSWVAIYGQTDPKSEAQTRSKTQRRHRTNTLIIIISSGSSSFSSHRVPMELCGLFQCSPVYGAASPAGKCVCKQRTCKRTGLRFTFILKTEFNKLLENNGEAAPHQRECGKFKEPCIASPPAAYACMQTHTDTQTFTVYSTTQTRQRTPTSANNPADDTAARHIMAQMLCMTYTRKHLSCTHDARARTWRAYTRRIG